MITVRGLTVFILIFMLIFTAPNLASAASIEITPAVQASLDKTTAAADRNKAAQITRLYNDFIALNDQNGVNEGQIKYLHDSNAILAPLEQANEEDRCRQNQSFGCPG